VPAERVPSGSPTIQLGLKENLGQFSLLVLVNAFVGGMVGLERTVVPLIGSQEFGLVLRTAIFSFIVTFGLVKAFSNLFAGGLADRFGRKKILVVGWLVGVPVPLILMYAPSWEWIVAANVLLGVNQGLAWSMTVIMKIDLVGPRRRGLAIDLNDGMSWGVFPLFFANFGLGVGRIGILKAVYPAVWGTLQVATGPLSDRWGRKGLIVAGMWVQATGIFITVATRDFGWWVLGSVLLGLGTAMVYPSLIAAVSDASHPSWRARSLSVYRFWRDLGYAVGALTAGVIADTLGISWAIGCVGALTFLSGAVVAVAMQEGAEGRVGSGKG
jgi:MFS family permease